MSDNVVDDQDKELTNYNRGEGFRVDAKAALERKKKQDFENELKAAGVDKDIYALVSL